VPWRGAYAGAVLRTIIPLDRGWTSPLSQHARPAQDEIAFSLTRIRKGQLLTAKKRAIKPTPISLFSFWLHYLSWRQDSRGQSIRPGSIPTRHKSGNKSPGPPSYRRYEITTGNRHDLAAEHPRLESRAADNLAQFVLTESGSLLFGHGFGIGTDFQAGPNDDLFVVSPTTGAICAISPAPGRPRRAQARPARNEVMIPPRRREKTRRPLQAEPLASRIASLRFNSTRLREPRTRARGKSEAAEKDAEPAAVRVLATNC
jgi:hypothetical protein